MGGSLKKRLILTGNYCDWKRLPGGLFTIMIIQDISPNNSIKSNTYPKRKTLMELEKFDIG